VEAHIFRHKVNWF